MHGKDRTCTKWQRTLAGFDPIRDTYQKRLDIFAHATGFCGNQAVTNAKSRLAVSLAKQLRLLQQQLQSYRVRITELFEAHPDPELFGSLPGVGEKLGPRLLSECGDDRCRFQDAESLQCYAGTAPVSFQSGQVHRGKCRRACNKNLRTAVHQWADLSRTQCYWAQVYYGQKRQEGKSHAAALRCLGQRWLKILWKMWMTKKPYDEQLHLHNQTEHGSWYLHSCSRNERPKRRLRKTSQMALLRQRTSRTAADPSDPALRPSGIG